jgi:MFS transporter, DHA3 family, macrolide efflux protein
MPVMENIITCDIMTEKPLYNKERLWTKNFFLLWQGQIVSGFGDVIYQIALGFWILMTTGSTGLMGIIMAATFLPRFFISPFAGVFVDRVNRKWLLVSMDLIRGIFVLSVGIAAYFNVLQIWMVFIAGIIIGICASFFNPTVGASIPDIVPKSKLIKANSVYSSVFTLSSILGNSIGGILFQLVGAPIMFLVNGISYLISAFTELFLKIPRVINEKKTSFYEDLKHGFSYIWKFKALRSLILTSIGFSFFANVGIILIMPLFQQTAGLGPINYGFVMASFTGGTLFGMILLSVINFKSDKKYYVFMFSGILLSFILAPVPLLRNIPLICLLVFIAGILNAIVLVFIVSSTQIAVPQNMRGKVIAITESSVVGIIPFAMAIGGILAEFISIEIIMVFSFSVLGLFFIPLFFVKGFKEFINVDSSEEEHPRALKNNTF